MVVLKDIYFGYGRKTDTLSNVSLALKPGFIHGLLGCNGVGKTTIMKIMSGLLLAKKGSITVGGHNPARRQPSFFREMFIIPEEFDLPHLTFENFAGINSGFYPSFSRELLDFYTPGFGIDTRAYLDEMSMGERKKAYLAFAFACQPKYLFMDEPTNGLDIPSKSVFKSMLASFITPDKTIVISTHQVADIQNLVDNIVIMDRGGVVLNDTVDRIGEALKFGKLKAGEVPLWSKDSLGGRVGIIENRDKAATVVDVEMLFNAVLDNKEQIIEILKRQKS